VFNSTNLEWHFEFYMAPVSHSKSIKGWQELKNRVSKEKEENYQNIAKTQN